MQKPCLVLSSNTKYPPPPPVVPIGARGWSRSGHLTVLGRSHPDHAGAFLAATYSRSLDGVICTAKTKKDTKLRPDKFFEIEMTVHDCELDEYQVVQNTFYSTYLHKARMALFASLGISMGSIACTGNAMALTELNIKYLKPLTRGEKFVVKVRFANTKGVRLFAEHFIETLRDQKLILEATATVVCLNKDYSPTRVFPDVSSKLQHFFSCQDG